MTVATRSPLLVEPQTTHIRPQVSHPRSSSPSRFSSLASRRQSRNLNRLRPIARRRINNTLRYLGFGTDIAAPGNWEVAGQSTSNGQPPLPAEEGGGVDVRPPLHCRCGPAVLPALTLFGNALVILPGRHAAVSRRLGPGYTQNPLQGDGPGLTAPSCQPSGEGE